MKNLKFISNLSKLSLASMLAVSAFIMQVQEARAVSFPTDSAYGEEQAPRLIRRLESAFTGSPAPVKPQDFCIADSLHGLASKYVHAGMRDIGPAMFTLSTGSSLYSNCHFVLRKISNQISEPKVVEALMHVDKILAAAKLRPNSDRATEIVNQIGSGQLTPEQAIYSVVPDKHEADELIAAIIPAAPRIENRQLAGNMLTEAANAISKGE